jgi:hypothetical protein
MYVPQRPLRRVALRSSLRLLLLQFLLVVSLVLRVVLFLALVLVLLAFVSHEAPPAAVVHQRSSPGEWIAAVTRKQSGTEMLDLPDKNLQGITVVA